MTYTLELSGEQIQMIRVALMRESNRVYQAGDSERSERLDAVEAHILNQIEPQRKVA